MRTLHGTLGIIAAVLATGFGLDAPSFDLVLFQRKTGTGLQ